MKNVKEWLQPETRGTVYAISAAIVAALVTFGFLSSTLAVSVSGVAVGIITLIYAVLHSESTVRTAFYSLCAAVGALFIALGIFTDAEADALLAVIAPVAGITLAAAKTPTTRSTIDDNTWVTHS